MESRRVPRVKIKTKVSISIDTATKQRINISKDDTTGEILDISVLGIGLLSPYFFPVGSVLKLSFILHSDSKKDSVKTINVQGEVRSAISGGRGLTRLGIQFVNLNTKEKDIISKFINKLIDKGEQT